MKIARKPGLSALLRLGPCCVWCLLSAVLLMGAERPARAQSAEPSPVATYAISAPDGFRAEALDPLVREWLSAQGEPNAQALPSEAPLTMLPALASKSDLEVLTRVEALLREARERAARFDEHLALQRFSEAEQLLRAALEIPHVHAWLAEVSLELGLCAAQLGAVGLAETALVRAASLDPERTLQAAEAPPNVVALAHTDEQRRASAPLSQVALEVEPVGATLWLDGRRLGQAPQELSVTSGVHVLRVAAPGYHPYATLLELGPGRRPPVRVRLAETPEEAARRALSWSLRSPLLAQSKARALASLTAGPVWLFEGGDGPLVRALAYRCDPDCTLRGMLGQGPLLAKRDQISPAAVRAWLQAEPLLASPSREPTPKEQRPWWKRWPVWTVGAVALVGAGLAAGLLATRDPQVVSERKLVLDPGELPSSLGRKARFDP